MSADHFAVEVMSVETDSRIDNLVSAERSDNEYGGSHYRLRYNEYHGTVAKSAGSTKIKFSSILAALIIFSLFISAGLIIFDYYNREVSELHNNSENVSKNNITFQAYTDGTHE